MRQQTETVSFRLTSDVLKLIDRERSPFGLSRGEWVRGLVVNHLQNNPVDKLAEELVEMRQVIHGQTIDVHSLHDSIRRLAYVLMTQAEPLSPSDAKEGVQKLFQKTQP